jgi:phage tail-like protein
MADNIEYLTNSTFFFDIDGLDLVISKVSGLKIEMKTAANKAAIGIGKDGKTQTQCTPGATSYSSGVKIEYVAGNEADQEKLTKWYQKCHATSFSGGATQSRQERKTGSLFIYDGNGKVCAEFEFIDLFPSKLTQTDQLGVDKSGELAKDTLEFRFTKCTRIS